MQSTLILTFMLMTIGWWTDRSAGQYGLLQLIHCAINMTTLKLYGND